MNQPELARGNGFLNGCVHNRLLGLGNEHRFLITTALIDIDRVIALEIGVKLTDRQFFTAPQFR